MSAIDRLGLQRLPPREGQQPVRQRSGTRDGGSRAVHEAACFRRATLLDPALHQFKAAADGLEHVVEVMRDAAGELAHRLHLLTLLQGSLHAHQLGRALLDLTREVLLLPGERLPRPLGLVHVEHCRQRPRDAPRAVAQGNAAQPNPSIGPVTTAVAGQLFFDDFALQASGERMLLVGVGPTIGMLGAPLPIGPARLATAS